MNKLLLFTITMIAQFGAMAQWISVPTMFAPFNGRVVSIDVGSSTQVMATAVHTNSSGYQCAYKYNFTTNLWDMYQDGQFLNVNFSSAAVASDGTIWTAAGNSKVYKNMAVKNYTFQTMSVKSNTLAVGCTPVFAGDNIYVSNAADVFNLVSSGSLKYDKVDVAQDGTMCGVYTYLGSTYITRYDIVNGWNALASNYTDIAVGDANKVLAVLGGQLFYFHVASSTWIRDITAPANVTSISLASDGTAYLLTSATSNNVYKSTWAKITCGVDDLATNTTPVSQQTICITSNTTTLTASASGTVTWFANTTTLTPIATGTALTTNTLAIGSYTYYAANTLTCGTSPRTPIVVKVEGSPGLSVGSTPLANLNICSGNTTTLSASASAGSTMAWYDTPTGGNLLGTGATYITPTLTNTTSFYVIAISVGGCVSTRTAAVTVYKSPIDISNFGAQNICYGQSTILSASSAPGSTRWYNAATGGTLLASAVSVNTGTLGTTSTFYAENNNAYCIPPRTPITVTVTPIPSAPVNTTPAGNQSVCYPNTTTTLSASGVGTLNWYASATGGTVLATGTTFTNPGIVFTTTYYVADNLGSCISPSRTPVTVTVTSVSSPAFTGSVSISICSGNTASLTASSPGPISWFASPTGTTALTTGTVYTTPTLTSNTSYYISTTSNGCESARAVKTVTVKPIPAAPTDETVFQGGSLNICSGQSTTIYTDNYDNWFTVPIGGSMIAGGSQYSTPSLTTNTTYYAEYNPNGCPSLRTAITVTVSACTGIMEAHELNSVSLQPNPASTYITLNNVVEGTSVYVMDVTGKVVISNSIIDADKTMTIETNDLSNGIYVIQLNNNGAVAHKKLIISK